MYKIEDIVNTILQGNALTVMKEIPDESIDLGITSTPYFGLRSYETQPQVWGGCSDCQHEWIYETKKGISGGTKSKKVRTKGTENFQIVKNTTYGTCSKCGAWLGELGQEPNIHLFISNLVSVFDEFRRILKPTGSLWVNLGDSYAANRSYQVTGTKQVQGSQPITRQPQANASGVRCKSLYGVPDRFKIAMIDNGWINRNEIIWQKDNQMPTSAKDRFTVDFEKFYWFTKNEKYYFEQQLEDSEWAEKDKRSITGRTIGGKSAKGKYAVKGSGTYRSDGKRNKRTVWSINTKGYKGSHFATFPPELVLTPIISCSPEGGIVMDMFFGTGTSAEVAIKNNRNYIGIELSCESIKLAEERLSKI